MRPVDQRSGDDGVLSGTGTRARDESRAPSTTVLAPLTCPEKDWESPREEGKCPGWTVRPDTMTGRWCWAVAVWDGLSGGVCSWFGSVRFYFSFVS